MPRKNVGWAKLYREWSIWFGFQPPQNDVFASPYLSYASRAALAWEILERYKFPSLLEEANRDEIVNAAVKQARTKLRKVKLLLERSETNVLQACSPLLDEVRDILRFAGKDYDVTVGPLVAIIRQYLAEEIDRTKYALLPEAGAVMLRLGRRLSSEKALKEAIEPLLFTINDRLMSVNRLYYSVSTREMSGATLEATDLICAQLLDIFPEPAKDTTVYGYSRRVLMTQIAFGIYHCFTTYRNQQDFTSEEIGTYFAKAVAKYLAWTEVSGVREHFDYPLKDLEIWLKGLIKIVYPKVDDVSSRYVQPFKEYLFDPYNTPKGVFECRKCKKLFYWCERQTINHFRLLCVPCEETLDPDIKAGRRSTQDNRGSPQSNTGSSRQSDPPPRGPKQDVPPFFRFGADPRPPKRRCDKCKCDLIAPSLRTLYKGRTLCGTCTAIVHAQSAKIEHTKWMATLQRNVTERNLTAFPQLPSAFINCLLQECQEVKADSRGPRCCQHDIKEMIKAAGAHVNKVDIVKKLLRIFHSDKFKHYCSPEFEDWDEKGRKPAEVMTRCLTALKEEFCMTA